MPSAGGHGVGDIVRVESAGAESNDTDEGFAQNFKLS